MSESHIDALIGQLVLEERARQDARWGDPKDLPNGTGPDTHPFADLPFAITKDAPIRGIESWTASMLADAAKRNCDIATDNQNVAYSDVLTEEHFEVLAEDDPEKLFDELIQVAAVAQKWCRALIEHQGVQR